MHSSGRAKFNQRASVRNTSSLPVGDVSSLVAFVGAGGGLAAVVLEVVVHALMYLLLSYQTPLCGACSLLVARRARGILWSIQAVDIL